jgi:hypothetical protein
MDELLTRAEREQASPPPHHDRYLGHCLERRRE